jgi:uncharacterized protein
MRGLNLLPREKKFFAFYEQQAENIVKMAQQLKDMVYVWSNLKERASLIGEMEQEGDAISHNINRLLANTFVTPFDREDITALADSLDEIADLIHEVADSLYLYGIEKTTAKAREMSEIILLAVLEVEKGVSEITGNIRKPDLLKRCVTINQIENSGDVVFRAALAELFDKPDDIALIVKWREIYKHMETAIDRCEDFADVLEGIAIKYG